MMNESGLQVWPANVLPIPSAAFIGSEPQEKKQLVDMDDSFPKGEIYKYFANQGYGFIKDRNGRDVFFHFNEMEFVGKHGKGSVEIGKTVGYDLVRSGRDLHIKRMKVY